MASLQDITPGTWNVDATHSEIGFVARHLMVTKVRGKFERFDADTVVAEDPKQSKVHFTVHMDSFTTGNEQRDGHVKSADFFDVENYPTMTFTATNITDDEITGDLTLKGITKPVTFEYEFNGLTDDPWGGTRAGFEANGEINRKDFNIQFDGKAESGNALVSDKIKINLDLQFVKA